MCGIVGYFNLNLQENNRLQILHRMCDAITYRGPDDEGYYTDDIVGLGMRRLSIIDLSSGHQPIHSKSGKQHIIFNGEIYNYQDLRGKLQQTGFNFQTESDTEVILAQYIQDGPACVNPLNGMFSIAIWDQDKQQLFLARDRLGIKPLYYYWDGKAFLFASEIKAILASRYVTKEVNQNALWDYLTFRYIPQAESIWKNIHKLLPGHTLTISTKQPVPNISRYWDIPYTDDIIERPEKDLLEEFTNLFLDAVRLRLIADVPVGILLSGGLDSSSVAAAIAEQHNARLNSFSVTFADSPNTDETGFARLVAQHVGTDHHEIVIGQKKFIDFLPRFVHYTDEPIADLASVPLYYVSHLASQYVKVVLSGEGSDEVLGGYTFDYYIEEFDRRRAFQKLPSLLRGKNGQKLLRRFSGNDFEKRFSANEEPLDQRLVQIPFSATNYLPLTLKQRLFSSHQFQQDSFDHIRTALKRLSCSDPLHQILFIFSQDWLVEDLLMKADRMSMANSIELRVPFLDYRLVEWTARTPAYIKVGRDPDGKYNTKRILRQFASSRLPAEIIEREKKGFPVPIYDWLPGQLKQWAFEILGDSNAKIYQWFDKNEVKNILEEGTNVNSTIMPKHYLWDLLILELWSRSWLTS